MSLCKVLGALIVLTLSCQALAIKREGFKIPKASKADLLMETNKLQLQQEATVQKLNPPSDYFLTFLMGYTHLTALNAASYRHVINYEFSNSLPMAAVEFSQYFINKSYGKW